jgi:hypothetical protein
LSKEEVENLLRRGAYDIFNEEKAGEAEAESKAFIEQNLDTIMQRHSQTIVHANTGSKSAAAGGTFSKASFKAKAADPSGRSKGEDVDVDDPDFWKKMIGEGNMDNEEEIAGVRRSRTQKNYSEKQYKVLLEETIRLDNDVGGSSGDESDDPDDEGDQSNGGKIGHGWGGTSPDQWKKEDVETLVKAVSTFGYGCLPWSEFCERVSLSRVYDVKEVCLKFGTRPLEFILSVSQHVRVFCR